MNLNNFFKKNKIIILGIILIFIVFSFILIFYLKGLTEKRGLETTRDLERFIWDSKDQKDFTEEAIIYDDLNITKNLKKDGIERYFLSEVEPINGLYTPTIHLCLYENQNQIYPSYLYRTWSSLQYPGYLTGQEPKIELIRYLLLPQDNNNFQPNESCYIKEIKTESDWQEIKEKYNFYQNLFH